jgi:hypothetical protein
VTKGLSNVRQEIGDAQVIYLKFPDVGQSREQKQDTGVELLRARPAEFELLDERKETKLARIPEWLRPPEFQFVGPPAGPNDESVMKVTDGGDVPGVASQGACEETVRVVDKVGNDHFDDLLGNLGEGGRECGRNLLRGPWEKQSPDPGWNSVPDVPEEQPNRCGEKKHSVNELPNVER